MVYSNRRAHTRYAFTIAVTLFQNNVPHQCSECRNLSRGGICVILQDTAFIQGNVSVALTKMYNNSLYSFQADCRVAWQDMNGRYDNSRMLGLEFCSIDMQNMQTLEQLLSFASMEPECAL